MKIICTTSNRYLHLIQVFTYLFNKYMPGYKVTILGYQAPASLPDNFTFHSMGEQGDVSEWSTDIRKYVEGLDGWFIWFMEDSFIRSFNESYFDTACAMMYPGIGRIDLTNDISKRPHVTAHGVRWAKPDTKYRLSTQPSIWNKEFLLNYLTPGLTPWQFECLDAVNDNWHVVGMENAPMRVNEGVRKHDIYALDLNGFGNEDVAHIKTLL